MKPLTAEPSGLPNSAPVADVGAAEESRINPYLELTKPRITLLVVLSSLAGFVMGSGAQVDFTGLLHVAVGIALLSSGIATLKQYLERDLDGRMNRTRRRPLPAGKLSANKALAFGIALSIIAEVYLAWFLNPLTAFWGLVALGSYLFLYTPLKTRTSWCTFIGAIPGALPPLLGWTAATNNVGVEALILFGILFLWQFPHFHAIATMYREDYKRAGIQMVPVVDVGGRRTALEIVLYTIALIPVSLLPVAINLSGWVYFAGALLLGLAYLYSATIAARTKSIGAARSLLRASVLYLPLLLLLMILNR